MPDRFTWRSQGHDDADAADDRLIAAHVSGGERSPAIQPYGDLLNAQRNLARQSEQIADAQRRRAARAEARLSQLRADLAWIALGVGMAGFGAGFALAWVIVRRGGGL